MQPVSLKIESAYETKTVLLEDEVSIGRTPQADIVLEDPGLSRVNTTIFRDGDEILIVDENSTNGTFLNDERLTGAPKLLYDGDTITLGSETTIVVSFSAEAEQVDPEKPRKRTPPPASPVAPTVQTYKPEASVQPTDNSPMILYVAVGSIGLIFLAAMIGILVFNLYDISGDTGTDKPLVSQNKVIPIRVIDPLGRQKQEDLDELVQYWEVQEKEVTAEDLDIQSEATVTESEAEIYKVDINFWKAQRAKAFANPVGPTGIWPKGLKVPAILRGDGVVKQKAKLREMQKGGYVIPMDFADLAEKRNQKLLVEMPMATDYWVLEVGGSSTTGPFTSFNFDNHVKSPMAQVGSPDMNIIGRLAQNFSGERYDLNNPAHRRQMKIRLLRMFNPRAKLALEELAKHYHAKFNKPLRVTSLSRSMEYQISLNKFNANSFKVRGRGSLPPHTSGCAFDLGRKHMGAEEQNYLMAKLEEMEKRGVLDALIEGNVNACFHVFVYEDGVPPAGY
ncbi:MAG: FHA domain-containing protein [Pyrinomonadaceae bacterium]|nr:FHA domain-containing protein [Pyrinomonadaceae bacterium]